MINYVACFMFVALTLNLNAQSIRVDSINFYDTLKFTQRVIRKTDNQIDYVQYDEKNGIGTIISLMIPYTIIFLIVRCSFSAFMVFRKMKVMYNA